MTRKDGKRSFYQFEKKGKIFVPLGTRMSSMVAISAAKKMANKIAKATGKTSGIVVYLRKAGVRDRVRRYEGEVKDFILVEPNSDLNRGIAGGRKPNTEEFKGDEPAFIQRNEYFAKHPNNPKTKAPWTEAEAAERNASLENGTLKLLPGKHIVYRSKIAKVKYIEVIKLPEGTALHPDSEPEGASEPEPEPEKKKGKGRKKSEPEPEPEGEKEE